MTVLQRSATTMKLGSNLENFLEIFLRLS